MKKLKRIIVGIDILAKTDNVLKRAFMLAKENKAELYIVYAVRTPWFSLPDYFGSKEIVIDKKGIKKRIEKKIKALDTDAKVSYFVLVKEGDPDDIMLYESKLLRADMIIIGSHSKSKTKKSILGTTAQEVAHQSHLPVLIVKNRAKKSYKNIAAPTDFSMQSKQCVLFAKSILPASKINAVHAFETFYAEGFYTAGPYTLEGRDLVQYKEIAKTHAKENLKEYLQCVGVKKGKVIDGKGNTKEELLKYIKKGDYDLVAIGSHGTSGFRVLLGSVASYLSREVPNDVLVYAPID